jgi:hypothetical protein
MDCGLMRAAGGGAAWGATASPGFGGRPGVRVVPNCGTMVFRFFDMRDASAMMLCLRRCFLSNTSTFLNAFPAALLPVAVEVRVFPCSSCQNAPSGSGPQGGDRHPSRA